MLMTVIRGRIPTKELITSSEVGYYDFKTHPELIRSGLEDFVDRDGGSVLLLLRLHFNLQIQSSEARESDGIEPSAKKLRSGTRRAFSATRVSRLACKL
jgi:hypothetical protein